MLCIMTIPAFITGTVTRMLAVEILPPARLAELAVFFKASDVHQIRRGLVSVVAQDSKKVFTQPVLQHCSRLVLQSQLLEAESSCEVLVEAAVEL
jgi:hypothetical protein